jgi:DNA primase
MATHHLSFPDAVERLAGEAGLEMPASAPEEREQARRAASLYDALEAAARFFEKELRGAGGRAALDYVRSRGVDEGTMGSFRLGWSPDARSTLKSALTAAGVAEALAVEAGLLVVPEDGGQSYDRFRGRLMFPITDRRGRVIAFGGRVLGQGQPKYLNSPDTPLFHKGSVLYGLAQAREAAAKTGKVIVCEGYMDVIALHRAGFAQAVAPLGTALTEPQIELLWRMAPEPVVCLDGDAAGQRAAAKAAERALPLLKPGLSLLFATVPAPEDPDSLIRSRGAAAMQEVLDRAVPLFEVVWDQELAGRPLDTPERRAAVERDLMEKAGRIPDRAVQDHYRRLFRDRLWTLFNAARPAARFSGGPRGASGIRRRRSVERGLDGRFPGAGLPPPPSPPWLLQERVMALLVIRYPSLLEEVAERLSAVRFADSGLDKLREEALKHVDRWGSLDSAGAESHLRCSGLSSTLDRLLDAGAHEKGASIKVDASVAEARELWERIFKLYTQRELAAELQEAEQQAAADLTEKTFAYLNALWSSKKEPDEP